MQESALAFSQVKPRKSLGQNFLSDPNVAEKEARLARVEGKKVLEIGAGTGALTIPLAKRALEVIAVEKDERLLPLLKEKLAGFPNVKIVCADFLEMKPEPVDAIVSNVPYSISSRILFTLPKWEFKNALLCIQKEFAQRMAAKPGEKNRSRLSFSAQYYFKPKVVGSVSRTSFRPVPDVESALVELEKKPGRPFDESLEKIANALFQHKKKTVRNALIDSRAMLGLEKQEAARLAGSIQLASKRVFELNEDETLRIAGAVKSFIK